MERGQIVEVKKGPVVAPPKSTPVSGDAGTPSFTMAPSPTVAPPDTGEPNRSVRVDRRDSGEPETSGADSMSTKSISTSDSSLAVPTMEIYKQRAVDSLMTEFKSHPFHVCSLIQSLRMSHQVCHLRLGY